jgi:hypothetical protein
MCLMMENKNMILIEINIIFSKAHNTRFSIYPSIKKSENQKHAIENQGIKNKNRKQTSSNVLDDGE